MKLKTTILITTLFLLSLNLHSQFGEYGELQITGVSMEKYDGDMGSDFIKNQFGSYSINYSRYIPLNLNTYFGVGLGYNYSPLVITSSGGADRKGTLLAENQKHFISIPLELVYYLSLGRASNQRDEEILTAYKRGLAMHLKLGVNTLFSPFESKSGTAKLNSSGLESVRLAQQAKMDAYAKNFNSLVFETYLRLGLTLNDKFYFYWSYTLPFINQYMGTDSITYSYDDPDNINISSTDQGMINFSDDFSSQIKKGVLGVGFGFKF